MIAPHGYPTVMPYLILKGALQFIAFTEQVFDARLDKSTYKMYDDGIKVQHAEIKIGDSIIMCTDASEEWVPQTANLFVYVDNADRTYQNAIDHGAISIMGLSDQSYGRTCGVRDPFDNIWWITSVIK